MSEISRRQFTQHTLQSLLTISALEYLFARDSFADAVKPVTAEWLKQLDTLGRDLKGKKLTQGQWQEQVEGLLGHVQLPELLTFIDFEKLRTQE